MSSRFTTRIKCQAQTVISTFSKNTSLPPHSIPPITHLLTYRSFSTSGLPSDSQISLFRRLCCPWRGLTENTTTTNLHESIDKGVSSSPSTPTATSGQGAPQHSEWKESVLSHSSARRRPELLTSTKNKGTTRSYATLTYHAITTSSFSLRQSNTTIIRCYGNMTQDTSPSDQDRHDSVNVCHQGIVTENITGGEGESKSGDKDEVEDREGSMSTQENKGRSQKEIENEIKYVIETKIAPTIEADGGGIQYEGYDPKTGIVSVSLHGACVSCSSSTVTLRMIVKRALMFYIEEVKGVKQVNNTMNDKEHDLRYNKYFPGTELAGNNIESEGYDNSMLKRDDGSSGDTMEGKGNNSRSNQQLNKHEDTDVDSDDIPDIVQAKCIEGKKNKNV